MGDRLRRFCDESWPDVKKRCRERMHAALSKKESLFLEWSWEGHPTTLANGENWDLPVEMWEPHGYELVLCLVKCLDTEGVIAAVRKREEKDGRCISDEVLFGSQKDR